jgi:hypothetical protein
MITVIPTLFDGILFRSRLEARWACFYKTLGIKYSYEHEGYQGLNGIRYLPDFYIEHLDCFIEIKGQVPNPKEEEKAKFLSDGLDKNVYIFFGGFPHIRDVDNFESDSATKFSPKCGWDNYYKWCECEQCGFLGIEYMARSHRLNCKCKQERVAKFDDKGYNGLSNKLIRAYDKAINERFD